jgi:hypothetical protein
MIVTTQEEPHVTLAAQASLTLASISVVNSTRMGKTPAAPLPPVFAASLESAWAIFRFGPEYPKQNPGMQFPLNALLEFWKQMVPDWAQTFPPALIRRRRRCRISRSSSMARC